MKPNDLYDIIREIVLEETIFLRHYNGRIVDNNDPLSSGRLKILVNDLGLYEDSLALWCWPRQGHSMSVPKIGQWAEIYFINGDREKPIYLYPATEIKDSKISSYSGDTKEHVIFESPDSKNDNIKYKQGILTLLNGTEKAVLGDKLKTWVDNFVSNIYNLHTHTSASPGNPSSVPLLTGANPTDIYSESVKVK